MGNLNTVLIISGTLVGYLAGTYITEHYIEHIKKIDVPTEKNIEQGYVVPSELEFKCQDLDQNGKKETIIIYKGDRFAFKVEGNKLVASKYKVVLE